MHSLEKKFFSILLREQALLVIFVIILLGIWATYLNGEWAAARKEKSSILSQLDFQTLVLAEEPAIEKSLLEIRAQFDPNKTLNLSKLSERIESLTNQAKVGGDVTRPNTQASEIFKINSVEILIKSKEIGKIMIFTRLLQDESPYISINELKITPLKSNPNLLNARFLVSSLELNQSF